MTEFVAPRWLRSPHLQTLGAAVPLFAPPRSHEALAHEELRIAIDETHKLHARVWWTERRAPAVIVVHGIGGSSESRYVVRAAVALHRAGYHVVRLDLRGAGGSIVDAPSLYHAGLTSDLARVSEHVARDARVDGVVLLGFSGGGTMSLKLAGEWGREAPSHVRGIVAISAPLDYTKVAPWMDSLGRIAYRFHVLRGLTTGAKEFARLHPDRAHYTPEDVKRMSTFRHYDGTIIVPMHGFSDVDEYYAAASAGPWLPK
ncbi:MAG TPA: alpha/beta fold hydrolase, partial [Labilithrix sp.]